MLIRITSNYFVAGFDYDTKRIAPIIKYMKHWKINKIKSYCKIKKWEVELYE